MPYTCTKVKFNRNCLSLGTGILLTYLSTKNDGLANKEQQNIFHSELNKNVHKGNNEIFVLICGSLSNHKIQFYQQYGTDTLFLNESSVSNSSVNIVFFTPFRTSNMRARTLQSSKK
jgi:hypothetical protein